MTEAYQRLSENGQVVGHARAGTVVASVPLPQQEICRCPRLPGQRLISSVDAWRRAFELFRSAPAAIDLFRIAGRDRLPTKRGSARSVRYWRISQPPIWDTGIRGRTGIPPRGSQMVGRNRGIQVNPDEVIIVAGVAQALALLARVLGQAGITQIAVEDPARWAPGNSCGRGASTLRRCWWTMPDSLSMSCAAPLPGGVVDAGPSVSDRRGALGRAPPTATGVGRGWWLDHRG